MAEELKLPLTGHLEELRKRLIISICTVAATFLVSYNFKEDIFRILTVPLINQMPKNSSLVFTSVAEAFFTYLKLALFSGIFFASPVVLFQLWMFVSPGLYEKEKKYAFPFLVCAYFFFILGTVFCYKVILPNIFKFLLSYSSDILKPLPSLNEYLSLSTKLLLAFGIMFEFPAVIFLLVRLGVVNAQFLVSKRKYAVIAVFILAAALTPPDIVTQLFMAVPLLVLYELSILFAKLFPKKDKRRDSKKEDNKEEGTEN